MWNITPKTCTPFHNVVIIQTERILYFNSYLVRCSSHSSVSEDHPMGPYVCACHVLLGGR
jgi:hypothetical protein